MLSQVQTLDGYFKSPLLVLWAYECSFGEFICKETQQMWKQNNINNNIFHNKKKTLKLNK